MTKYDYFIKYYVEHVSNFLKKYFISNQSAYGNALEDFEKKLKETKGTTKQKKLEKKPKVNPKYDDTKYLKKIAQENHDGFSILMYFRKKSILTQKYQLAPENLQLQYTVNTFDTQLPMPKEITDSYFLNGRNSCKLAGVFGGIPIGHNRLRRTPNVCQNVKWSCCTSSTFKNFKYNADLGMSRARTYYYNRFRIDLFFLTKLIPGDKAFKMDPYKTFNTRCKGQHQLAKCEVLMNNIKQAQHHAIMYFDKYINDYSKCIDSIESLRVAIRCASCDSENMYLINDQEKIAYIKRDSMNKIIKSCYNFDLYRNNLLKELYIAY